MTAESKIPMVQSEKKPGVYEHVIASMNTSNNYFALKLVSHKDPVTGILSEPVPQLTSRIDGSFVNMPIDGEFWASMAEFSATMASVLEGVKYAPSKSFTSDLKLAQEAFKAFRK